MKVSIIYSDPVGSASCYSNYGVSCGTLCISTLTRRLTNSSDWHLLEKNLPKRILCIRLAYYLKIVNLVVSFDLPQRMETVY